MLHSFRNATCCFWLPISGQWGHGLICCACSATALHGSCMTKDFLLQLGRIWHPDLSCCSCGFVSWPTFLFRRYTIGRCVCVFFVYWEGALESVNGSRMGSTPFSRAPIFISFWVSQDSALKICVSVACHAHSEALQCTHCLISPARSEVRAQSLCKFFLSALWRTHLCGMTHPVFEQHRWQ